MMITLDAMVRLRPTIKLLAADDACDASKTYIHRSEEKPA